MGCFISLICGMRESERRSETRQRDRLNSTSGLGSNEEILVYSPDADILRRYPALKENESLGIPLKRIQIKWRPRDNMTFEEIKERRKSFWETCHTNGGQAQVWDALKLVCEESSDDLILADSILASCGVILPFGQLTEIYDSKGFRYNLPLYCVCDPVISESMSFDASETIESSAAHNKEQVKIRLSDGKDVILDIKGFQKIEDLKMMLRSKEMIDLKRRMVVIWCGKVLGDEVNIDSLNLPKGAILQVLIP